MEIETLSFMNGSVFP